MESFMSDAGVAGQLAADELKAQIRGLAQQEHATENQVWEGVSAAVDREAFAKMVARFAARHEEKHSKDTVCLFCLNRRLKSQGWTYKAGERAVRVNRYVSGKTGTIYRRK